MNCLLSKCFDVIWILSNPASKVLPKTFSNRKPPIHGNAVMMEKVKIWKGHHILPNQQFLGLPWSNIISQGVVEALQKFLNVLIAVLHLVMETDANYQTTADENTLIVTLQNSTFTLQHWHHGASHFGDLTCKNMQSHNFIIFVTNLGILYCESTQYLHWIENHINTNSMYKVLNSESKKRSKLPTDLHDKNRNAWNSFFGFYCKVVNI